MDTSDTILFFCFYAIVIKYKKELEIIAEGLLEYETLSGDEILDLLKGKNPDRPDTDGTEEPPSDPTAVPTESAEKKASSKAKKTQKMKPQTQP